jgi:hypothetical protein
MPAASPIGLISLRCVAVVLIVAAASPSVRIFIRSVAGLAASIVASIA